MSYSSPSFTVGNVLRRAVEVFAADAGRYIALMLIPFLPLVGLAVALPLTMSRSAARQISVGAILGAEAIVLVALLVVFSAFMHATVGSMEDRPVRLGTSLAAGLSRFWPVLGVSIVLWIAVSLGTVLLIVPGVLIALAYFLALPIAVMERRGVFGSLQRAADLSRGYRGTLFGIGFCYLLIVIAGNVGVRFFISPIVTVVAGLFGPAAIVLMVLFGLATLVAGFALVAYQYVLLAVIYQMLRHERDADDGGKLAGVFA